jgi:hypothetical protein
MLPKRATSASRHGFEEMQRCREANSRKEKPHNMSHLHCNPWQLAYNKGKQIRTFTTPESTGPGELGAITSSQNYIDTHNINTPAWGYCHLPGTTAAAATAALPAASLQSFREA